jgi:hypothetical protein
MLGPLDSAVRSFEQSFFHEPMCWFVEGKDPAPPPGRTIHWEQSGHLDLNLACQSLFIATWMDQCNALQLAISFFSSGVVFRLLPRPGHRPSQYSKLSPSFWHRGPAPSQLINSNDTAHNGPRCLLLVWNLAGCGHDTLPLHFQIRVHFRSKILATHLCIGCV